MSFLQGLFSGGVKPAPAAAPAPAATPAPTGAAPSPAAAPVAQQGAPEGQHQAPGMPQPTSQASQTPGALDLFASLVQNNGAGQATAAQAPSFTLPTETLQQASSKLDFAQGIPPEAIQRLQAGDMTALTEILNHTGRQAYQHAMTHSMALTDRFVSDRFQYESGLLDDRIGQRMATSNLQSVQELHPVAQNMFREAMRELQKGNPNATQAQLEAQAWTFLEEFGQQFNRTGRQQQQQQQAAQTNWDAYGGFTGDTQ